MDIRKRLAPYFTFTVSERRGILVLILLMVTLISVRIFLSYYRQTKEFNKIELFGNLEDSTYLKNNKEYLSDDFYEDNLNKSSSNTGELIINQAQKQELLNAGFSNFAIGNIIKYREKGGIFYQKNDLLKIYGLDTSSLRKIEENVVLIYATANISENTTLSVETIRIELNSADTNTLMMLDGIGSILSKRIIKFRSMLGGYSKIEQLKEVYGINEELLLKISGKINIDTSLIIKLNVNSANENTFANHPYITNYQARAILNYRKLIGQFKQVNQLLESNIFNPEEFNKIASYLAVN